MVAEQRDARSARPAQRGVEREPAGGLHELGLEPVALGLEREHAGQAVESLEVAARRVDVDPRGEVGEQEVELGAGAPVNARGLREGDRRVLLMPSYVLLLAEPRTRRRSTSAGSTICPSRPT